jgi:hypothetical protein
MGDPAGLILDSTIVRAHQHAAGAKGGSESSIGRSRSGLTSKVHPTVGGAGLPVRCLLTAGHATTSPGPRPRSAAWRPRGSSATRLSMPITSTLYRSHPRAGRHSRQPITGTEAAARPAHLQGTASLMLFQQTQALPADRHPDEKTARKPPCLRHCRHNRSLAPMTVNRT